MRKGCLKRFRTWNSEEKGCKEFKTLKLCDSSTSARLFSTLNTCDTVKWNRRENEADCYLNASSASTSPSPHIWFVYRCPNCPERRGMEWRGFKFSRYSREERMIAILLLLSPMYQVNHSSILPQSSPGFSGRHGRKIGKVSPGRRWRRVEMDGTGGRVARKV